MEKKIAKDLLSVGAVFLRPENLFTWASGIKSPMYCDNRLTLSFPAVRKDIEEGLAELITKYYPEAESLMGTSTAGIAHAAITAWILDKPMGYVRGGAKDHGRGNRIEGKCEPGTKVVVVEDLISTGGNAVRAIEAVNNAGCEAVGIAALFNYEFPIAIKRFREANINAVSLCSYTAMLEVAEKIQFISPSEAETLRDWRKNPDSWVPQHEAF